MKICDLFEAPNQYITNTNAFKLWFADSKVVDSQGKPLVVYHGTYRDFDVFKPGSYEGILAFFSNSPDFASGYAQGIVGSVGSVMPVYLRIERPFDYRKNATVVVSAFWDQTGGIHDPIARWQIRIALYGKPDIEDHDNPDIHEGELDFGEFVEAVNEGFYPAIEAPEFVNWLKDEGYDGLIMREAGATTYAIFEPDQVKSAISNTTFTNGEKITENFI